MMTGPGDEKAAGGSDRGHLRASQADREQVIAALRAAFIQGRLTRDEFDLRLGRALGARTCVEVAALTADIPAGPTGPVARNAPQADMRLRRRRRQQASRPPRPSSLSSPLNRRAHRDVRQVRTRRTREPSDHLRRLRHRPWRQGQRRGHPHQHGHQPGREADQGQHWPDYDQPGREDRLRRQRGRGHGHTDQHGHQHPRPADPRRARRPLPSAPMPLALTSSRSPRTARPATSPTRA